MKILALSTWFPFPPDNGARIRTYHLLCQLGAKHTIDLLAVSQQKRDMDYMDDVHKFCRRVATFPANRFRPESSDAFWRLFSTVPRCFEARHVPEMEALAARWTEEEHYDVVLAETLGAAPYAVALDAPIRILDQHNVESEILKRQWQNEPSTLRRLRYAPTWIKANQFERRMALQFDLITVVSEPERVLMDRLLKPGHGKRMEIIPNGVDADLLGYESPVRESNTIVYTGAMTYESNRDAASWLCSDILPVIQERLPNTRLRITGRHNGVDISDMESRPGVEFTGYVDDVHSVIASASALVVPLKYGGGTRLKILEAMALRTPVVSTPVGAEGLGLEDGKHLLIGRTSSELAEKTCLLLTDRKLASRIADAAWEAVKDQYQWSAIAETFEKCVSTSGMMLKT